LNNTFLIVIPCLLFNQFPFAFTYSYIGNFNSKICFLVHLFCLHFFFFLQQACATNFVSGCNWHTVDRNYHEDYAAYCLHVIDVAGFFDHFRHWAVPSSARALNSWLLWLSNTLPVLILSILLLVRLGLCHQIGWSLLGFHSSAFLAHQVSAAEFLELLGLTWRTQIQLYGQSVRYCIDIEALSFLEADWRAPLTDQLHRRSLLSTWLGEIFFLLTKASHCLWRVP
jgi:hypothetical protein